MDVSTADATKRGAAAEGRCRSCAAGESGEELSRLRVHVVVHPGLEEPLITDSTIESVNFGLVTGRPTV